MASPIVAWFDRRAGIRALPILAALAFGSHVLSQQSSAQGTAYLTIDGEVPTALSLSETDFKALPRSTMSAKDEAGTDQNFEGVDLALLLLRAGTPLKTDLKGTDVAKYLHAEGTDGFAAVFSLPEFDHQAFLVADTRNGGPLTAANGPLQIISPNETRHSRWVKHLTLLLIKKTQK
jgi:hypothetical protein